MGGRSSSPPVVEEEYTDKQDELTTKKEFKETIETTTDEQDEHTTKTDFKETIETTTDDQDEHTTKNDFKETIETTTDEQDEDDAITAEKYILIARMAIANNDVARAEKLLLKSLNIHSLNQAEELLEKLKNEHEYNEQSRPKGTLEQAEECIEKARNAFDEGNCKKALRLLTKSERIYPTTRAKNLMQQVKNEILENGEDPDEVLQEGRKATERKDTDVPPPELKKREVTSEQIREIKRVLDAFDDYDILGISKGSSLDEVKQAYCRLTKTLHPDKNKAEEAKLAFMTVKKATDRLKSRLRP